MRTALLGITTAVASLCAFAASETAFTDGVLYVDGRPFFPVGVWGADKMDTKVFASLGFNTLYVPTSPARLELLRRRLDEGSKLGFKVVPYFQFGNVVKNPTERKDFETFIHLHDHPALLAWATADDLHMDRVPHAREVAKMIRAKDTKHPITGDMLYTGASNPTSWHKTVPDLFDIPFQYQYPFPEMPYNEYMREVQWWRLTYRTGVWTWIQCFTWSCTAQRYLGLSRADRSGPVPDPEQIRLQTYWALTRGVRGIFFFRWACMKVEPSRMAECSLLARELSLVNEHLAGGDVWGYWYTDRPATSDKAVYATSWHWDDSYVIAMYKMEPQPEFPWRRTGTVPTGQYVTNGIWGRLFYNPLLTTYNRYVDEAVVRDVQIKMPLNPNDGWKAWSINFPQVHALPVKADGEDSIEITVPELEITGLVLLAKDEAKIEPIRKKMAAGVPLLAKLFVEALPDRYQRLHDVYAKCGISVEKAEEHFRRAHELSNRARRELDAGKNAQAFITARLGYRELRRAVTETMTYADSRFDAVAENKRHLCYLYWSLPAFFAAKGK